MKKTEPKQIMLYVILLGAILLIGVYFLVYKRFQDSADQIEQSNVALEQRVAELKDYYDNMENYKKSILAMQDTIHEILGYFPADVREEDMIVLALSTLKDARVEYTNINVGEKTTVKAIGRETVQNAAMEDLTDEITFVSRTSTYVNMTSYQDLKEILNVIYDSGNRVVVNKLAYSRSNDNAKLSGTIEVTFYSVLGTGREYEEQNLAGYANGLYELFGSGQVIKGE